jgi:hypothetical protein
MLRVQSHVPSWGIQFRPVENEWPRRAWCRGRTAETGSTSAVWYRAVRNIHFDVAVARNRTEAQNRANGISCWCRWSIFRGRPVPDSRRPLPGRRAGRRNVPETGQGARHPNVGCPPHERRVRLGADRPHRGREARRDLASVPCGCPPDGHREGMIGHRRADRQGQRRSRDGQLHARVRHEKAIASHFMLREPVGSRRDDDARHILSQSAQPGEGGGRTPEHGEIYDEDRASRAPVQGLMHGVGIVGEHAAQRGIGDPGHVSLQRRTRRRKDDDPPLHGNRPEQTECRPRCRLRPGSRRRHGRIAPPDAFGMAGRRGHKAKGRANTCCDEHRLRGTGFRHFRNCVENSPQHHAPALRCVCLFLASLPDDARIGMGSTGEKRANPRIGSDTILRYRCGSI